MNARLHVNQPLEAAAELRLPDAAARHAQVLRMQPGDGLTLFDGRGGEWSATVLRMGRSEVWVSVQAHRAVEREIGVEVTLALGMPANERMDMLVEKATELGVAAIQPLMTERSVLRLAGDRAEKRRQHWQGIAVAASEQSGRTRVPAVAPILPLPEWLRMQASGTGTRWILSLDEAASPLASMPRPAGPVLVLSGPEGGLSAQEESAARSAGFGAVGLGNRTLRADTAPLAVLAFLGLAGGVP